MSRKTEIIYSDIAPGAAEAATASATIKSEFSNLNKLTEEGLLKKISALERNYWTLDGTAGFTDGTPFASFISNAISDENCVLSSAPVITISFTGIFSAPGITIDFDTVSGEWCSEINVKWYNGTDVRADVDYSPDSPSYFCRESVLDFDRIVITIKKTSLPYRRTKIKGVLIGVIRTFGMSDVKNASVTKQANLISTELPISTFKWTLNNRDDIDFLFQERQPVEVRSNNSTIGIFYVTKAVRSSADIYSIDCEDAIGVLSDTPFPGGAYLNGISAKSLVESIINDEFDVDFSVSDVTLKGVIKSGTRRDALRQVLFALGAMAIGDGEKIHIIYPDSTLSNIGIDRVYMGVTVNKEPAVTQVQLEAHTYAQSDSGSVEINGVKYSDTATMYTRSNPKITSNSKSNVKSINDATLISVDLAAETADRLEAYYFSQKTGNGQIVWQGEQLGDYVSIPDAWGGRTTGHISKMEMTLSNTVAASITVEETCI